MLAKARDRGVIGIVEYIAHEDIMVDGKPDNLFDNVMKGLQVGKAINMVAPKSKSEGQDCWAVDQALAAWKKCAMLLHVARRDEDARSSATGKRPHPAPANAPYEQQTST